MVVKIFDFDRWGCQKYDQSPSQKSEIFASPLYTRGPWRIVQLLDKLKFEAAKAKKRTAVAVRFRYLYRPNP